MEGRGVASFLPKEYLLSQLASPSSSHAKFRYPNNKKVMFVQALKFLSILSY